MLKKIIAASAIFALFACSGKDNDDFEGNSSSSQNDAIISSSSSQDVNGDSSSSQNEESSSSSSDPGPQIETITIASFNNKASELFGNNDIFPYGFTLKAGANEDLEQFWDIAAMLPDTLDAAGNPVPKCPTKSQQSKPKTGCELNKTDAILQNTITNQYSDLHYDVVIKDSFISRIGLTDYSLKANGDQAALGLSVGFGANEGKTIEELNITKLNEITAFVYNRKGGVHKFRAVAASVDDQDFWEYKVPASADFAEIVIPVSELEGMGSFAGSGADDGVLFDIKKVVKFLWVVEYDNKTSANNQGSLLVSNFKAQKMLE